MSELITTDMGKKTPVHTLTYAISSAFTVIMEYSDNDVQCDTQTESPALIWKMYRICTEPERRRVLTMISNKREARYTVIA